MSASNKAKYHTSCKELSSFKVFKLFLKYDQDGNCDASGIISPECYIKWKASRKKTPKNPQEAFRRALTAHIRGVDGRRPFEEDIESNLLSYLRKKKVWNCFSNTEGCFIGVQGFPSLGYHEKKKNPERVKLVQKKKAMRKDVVFKVELKRSELLIDCKTEREMFSRKRTHEDLHLHPVSWNHHSIPEYNGIDLYEAFLDDVKPIKRKSDVHSMLENKKRRTSNYDDWAIKTAPLDFIHEETKLNGDLDGKIDFPYHRKETSRRFSEMIVRQLLADTPTAPLDFTTDLSFSTPNWAADQICF